MRSHSKNNSKRNNIIDKEEIKKGVNDKKHVERVLSGYTLRKDKIKKKAQQKILQKKFKEDAKEQALKEEARKEKERKEK